MQSGRCSPAPTAPCELRAFAAPRNGDLWGEVRPQIAADMARRGGTATEREGRCGTELVCQMPVKRPDGTDRPPSRRGSSASTATAWMLRATLLGPARPLEPDDTPGRGRTRSRRSSYVVATQAMPVGEPLPADAAARRRSRPPVRLSPMGGEEPAAAHHQPWANSADQHAA